MTRPADIPEDASFEDDVLALLLKHFDTKTLRPLTYEQWKDGIDITRVGGQTMAFAMDLLLMGARLANRNHIPERTGVLRVTGALIDVGAHALEQAEKVGHDSWEETSERVSIVLEAVFDALASTEAGEMVLVPREITPAMQRAYFDVIDRNMDRVTTDATFGRHESQKEAYRAMLAEGK